MSLDLRLAVLSWAIHAEELPEQLKAVPPTHFLGREMYLSHCEQQNAIMHARQELVRHYRFRANNVDKDFTDEEQAAAQEKLRQLSTRAGGSVCFFIFPKNRKNFQTKLSKSLAAQK